MNKYLMMLVAAGLVSAVPAVVKAEDHAAPAAVEATEGAAADAAAEVKEATLKDGTKIEIKGEEVHVVAADGAKTPAPDGEHELADGTKVTTKDGKIVPAAMEEHKEEAAH